MAAAGPSAVYAVSGCMISTAPLRRSRDERMIAGVVGGLAAYWDKDPTLLRVLYVLLSMLSAAFPGVLVYIILWVIIPEEPRA